MYCVVLNLTKPSSRCLNFDIISRRLVANIHGLSDACEKDESSAFTLITSYLSNINSALFGMHPNYKNAPKIGFLGAFNFFRDLDNTLGGQLFA